MLGGNLTRNAVIGKVSRLHLPRRKTVTRLAGAAGIRNLGKHQPHPWHKPKPPQRPNFPASRAVFRTDAPPLPVISPAEFDVPRIATADLEPHHCRFPCVSDVREVGAFAPIFCGLKPVPGLPYCEVHSRRAFQPPQVRSRQLDLPAETNVVPMPVKEKVAA
jgi:GcrA cell cycle regulator